MCKIVKQVMRARDKGVPLLGITTSDQIATVTTLRSELRDAGVPVIEWDFCLGFQAFETNAQQLLAAILGGKEARYFAGKPADSLNAANILASPCVLIFHNAQRYLDTLPVIQAIANLREGFKAKEATLILLGPSLTLPVELTGDVLLYDEPLPNDEQLREMLAEVVESGELADYQAPTSAVDALRGLSLFAAEQVAALALRATGFDLAALWERKRQMIEATPGLSVWRGTGKFADIGGVARIKQFLTAVINGLKPPQVVVIIDEIDKVLGGSHDTSGVSQDYLGVLLSYMQDNQADGMIFIGPPGATKTATAQAAGNEAGIPTVTLDLGGMKGSLVGQSEQRIRAALKTITAIGAGQTLFIATCNKIATLPPELRRRFNRGTFFFDLPTKEERALIWDMYCKRYGVPAYTSDQFDDTDWTGAEIQQCARMAHELKMTLAEAAGYVVPVAKAAHEAIKDLRTQAAGRYLSASAAGVYQLPTEKAAPVKRRITSLD